MEVTFLAQYLDVPNHLFIFTRVHGVALLTTHVANSIIVCEFKVEMDFFFILFEVGYFDIWNSKNLL
ncbi:MAG: hypothetical protein AABX82_07210 [Nanoarchaeota archaeon]